MSHAWGKPNSNPTVAATIDGDPTKATIFGYDTGAAMVTGTAAAARVGFMYYGGNGATHFNDNAAQLFDASIQWAAKSAPHIEYQRDASPTRSPRTRSNGCLRLGPLRLHRVSRHPRAAPSTQPAPSPNAPTASPEARSSPPGQPGERVVVSATCTATSSPPPTTPVSSKAPPGPMTRSATSWATVGCRTTPPERSTTAGTANNNDPPTTKLGLTPLVEIGARQYSTQLGRFLETDPIRGGVDNDYNYPNDPINNNDLTGESSPFTNGLFGLFCAVT